jgi:hypothetical protein
MQLPRHGDSITTGAGAGVAPGRVVHLDALVVRGERHLPVTTQPQASRSQRSGRNGGVRAVEAVGRTQLWCMCAHLNVRWGGCPAASYLAFAAAAAAAAFLPATCIMRSSSMLLRRRG